MRSAFFLFGVCSLFFVIACSKKEERIKTDVEIKHILAESMQGCNYDTLQCAQFEVTYPVLKGLDSAVQQIVMQRINHNLSNGAEDEVKPLQLQASEFINEYKEFKKETPDMFGRWYRSISIEVMTFNDSLLSMQVSDESFEGGAHGLYNLSYVNLRPNDGSVFTLNDFLKPGYNEALTKIGEEIFRTTRELADTSSYEMNGFSFDNNKFALNDNYGFRSEGIVFYYNSYEVAPYSEGPTEILIPYERIKDWIRQFFMQRLSSFPDGLPDAVSISSSR